MYTFWLTMTVVAALSYSCGADNKVVYCYYATWATYREGDGTFNISTIDPFLCTHVVYAFAGLTSAGTVNFLEPTLDFETGKGTNGIEQFVALKKKNPKLKTIFAIGGWNEGSANYSRMVNSPKLRKTFVQNVTATLLKYGFDGMDLDWEFPNQRDTIYGKSDIAGFSQVLQQLKTAFKAHNLLLIAAVGSVKSIAKLSYDIPSICKSLDFVSLMTYDLYNPIDNVTGYNSAVYKGLGDEKTSREDALTMDAAVNYWITQGCPANKILLGVPLYGRTYKLKNPSINGLRAPSIGSGIAGPYTEEPGNIGYNEFCLELKKNASSWIRHYDEKAQVPYAVRGRDWVSYEDTVSVALKVLFALQRRLRGIMVWAIDMDDFGGYCDGVKFPLMKIINRGLGRK